MKTFISMLRGINVSGQKKIKMADLSRLYESLGLVNVETYVQSGNVVFDSPEQDAAKLAQLIEAQIERDFGYSVPVFIRDTRDFQRTISSNPFANETHEDPIRLFVTFFYAPVSGETADNLNLPIQDGEKVSIGETELFFYCPGSYGKTKLSNNFFEKKLKVSATTRNWKTVVALYNMANRRAGGAS